MDYRPGLNELTPLAARVEDALAGARSAHLAVAYAKTSGVALLTKSPPPPSSRVVVGLGFGITDPTAVEQLASAGFDVKVVSDGEGLTASQFHPKVYLVERPEELVALTGSANLTGSGWTTNVEQFEELRFPTQSAAAEQQRKRYEHLWAHGTPLTTFRRSGDWEIYRQRARDRRLLEREDRRQLLRLQAQTGQLVGQLARKQTRSAPGYVGITNDEWWDLQLHLRDTADRALFWRRNTNDFKALAEGGVFFHLVKEPHGPEDSRAIRGFSTWPGAYEVGPAADLYRRYGGAMLGVVALTQLHERLSIPAGSDIGVIHLEGLTELDRPVPLYELRANGIQFARNIVSGKSLTLEQVATIFELGGLTPDVSPIAAEERGSWS